MASGVTVTNATGLLADPDTQQKLWDRIVCDVVPKAEYDVTVDLAHEGLDSDGRPNTFHSHVTFGRPGATKLLIVSMHQVCEGDGVHEWEYEQK